MFRLTREVRFAAVEDPDQPFDGKPSNSYGGFPTLRRFAPWLALQVTVAGTLESQTQYLLNIKDIDAAVRRHLIRFIAQAATSREVSPERVTLKLFEFLRPLWPALTLECVALSLSPLQQVSVNAQEYPMVQLSQKFEFSATHRLHNPALNEADNRRTYGKCNNPHGHGHNYELQVKLSGKVNESGTLIDMPAFERIVATTVIDKFDHRNLNVELSEFRQLIPTVENIAMTIYRLLKPAIETTNTKLASVTVWETPKTWCEYSE